MQSVFSDLHTATAVTFLFLVVVAWMCFSGCTYLHAWLRRLASGEPAPRPSKSPTP